MINNIYYLEAASQNPVGCQYMFIDGVNFDMRMGDTVEKVPVLAAIGVTESGTRLVLGLQSGDKESASNWREFFKDLKRRGLPSHLVKLGIMDGLTGLETLFTCDSYYAAIAQSTSSCSGQLRSRKPSSYKGCLSIRL
ncbi:hypothetical protein C2W62_47435 [Candidatus Entotheonella serta]|nr:hypothetical protein C2W62_47435 [Candidatus Entotheonella serta]